MGTVIILMILTGLVALSIRSMIRAKKSGKLCGCGGDCGRCQGNCHK